MPLAIPTGYAQCSVEISNAGDPEPWYVTHGIDISEAAGDFVEAGLIVMGSFGVAWQSYLTTSSRVSGVYLTIGSDGGNYTLYITPGTAIVGTSNADKLPQNCAYLVQKQTLRPGRAGKGRCYLPGVAAEGSVNDVGVIQGSALTTGQAACNTWLDELNTGGSFSLPMFLLHNQGIPGGSVPTKVERLQLDTRIATQRRRLRR